ncbi:MAG: C39 family peptidase [Verrucomicrobiaceae bacterium]|nr:C39 family peptidase [Verrucomicrobiaceae bacterium]
MNTSRVLLLLVLAVSASSARSQNSDDGGRSYEFKGSLDAVLSLADPFALTPEKLEAAYAREGFKTSPFFAWSADRSKARLGRHPYANINVDFTMLGGRVDVEEAVIVFKDGKADSYEIEVPDGSPDPSAVLRSVLKDAPAVRLVKTQRGTAVTFSSWVQPRAVIVHSQDTVEKHAGVVTIVKPAEAGHACIHKAGAEFALLCDLDFLLDYPSTWQLSAESMDQRFDFAGRGFKEQPFFKWLSDKKDRLRFARQPFSNITVDLRLFGGRVAVDEATVDFTNGRASLVNVSVYNRGDSGGMGPPEFEALFKACGQALGQLLKVSPQRRQNGANQAVKTVGWMWQAPVCLALMEHNEYGGGGKKKMVMPEFLRLKLAPPANKDWNFGVSATGLLTSTVTKSSLSKNVTKKPEGDVYITGVPMVDQGAKGYCVVASCQRLFEYYKIACDQHEMAQLAGTGARTGTSSMAMEETLGKIDNRFKTRFKPLISPSLRRERSYRAPDEKKFGELVKSYVTEGVPLLWALDLGVAKEDPPLPVGGQMSGGHMRMIIGYNETKGQLLFTDSWGAGHELKRMRLDDGFRVTEGLYVLQPRG